MAPGRGPYSNADCFSLLSRFVKIPVHSYLQALFLILQGLILLLEELQSFLSGGKLLLIVLRQFFGSLRTSRFAFQSLRTTYEAARHWCNL